MKLELENKLYSDYPELFIQRTLPMTQTCMCWGINCNDGWYNLIDNLCKEIQDYIDNTNSEQVEVVQLKEKFGTLRFYTNHSDDTIYSFIEKAELLSSKTCEICGTTKNIGTTLGWIITCCENCSKTLNRGWKRNDKYTL